jgi:hypothetical protein
VLLDGAEPAHRLTDARLSSENWPAERRACS